jgi:hypothetical protein
MRKIKDPLFEKRAGARRPERLDVRLEYCASMLYIYGVLSEKDRDKIKKRIKA